jgi:hypothetical protein
MDRRVCDFLLSPDVVRMRWEGYVAHLRGSKCIQNCRWKNIKEGNHLGEHMWEDNIKMDIKEVGVGYGSGASGSLWAPVMNFWGP